MPMHRRLATLALFLSFLTTVAVVLAPNASADRSPRMSGSS
ncbi:hypothetical protein AB0G86_19010 [Streptomyces scabiei]